MKILVRMPNWIGDLVMATPVLIDLRRAFPEAEITAMCLSSACELLEEDPSIDELFCFHKLSNTFSRRLHERNIIEQLRVGQYDLGILLTHSFSSAWLFFQGRVAKRLGYPGHFRRWLLTEVVRRSGASLHQVDRYKALLHPLGISRSETKPRLVVLEKEVEASKELLYQRGYRAGQSLIGINPGAAYGSAKCWPPERFRELAFRLTKEDPGALVLVFGDATHAELVKEICAGLPRQVIDLAGVTSLRELACLIKDCDVLITNDSGPMHIGAAFGTPLVALFGSTEDAVTGPYGQPEAVIHKRPSCSPCFKRVCPLDFRCMKQISVEEVLGQALARRKSRV